MRNPTSFAEQSRKLTRGLAVAVIQALVLAAWIAGAELLPWEVGASARRGFGLALLVGPCSLWLAALPRWSVLSHELAVAHGQICRWSSSWAVWGWLIPGVQLWLPFVILRARGRFYGLAAPSRLWWSQAAFCLAVLQVFTPWSDVAVVAAGICVAVGFYWLRAAISSMVRVQVLAEQSATAERVFG